MTEHIISDAILDRAVDQYRTEIGARMRTTYELANSDLPGDELRKRTKAADTLAVRRILRAVLEAL